MPTIRFTMAPPTDAQIRDMMTPGVVFVTGNVTGAPTYDLEVDAAATADDIEQVIANHRPLGWSGAVLP